MALAWAYVLMKSSLYRRESCGPVELMRNKRLLLRLVPLVTRSRRSLCVLHARRAETM